MRPAALRRELARLLDRLGLTDEHAPPSEIAVVLALRDGIPLRDALERLGVDTAPLDLPPPPEAIPFERIAPGCAFTWQDHTWTRATLDGALAATPERHDHPRVVAAYLASTQRGRPATAFRWASGEETPEPTCIAERVEADESVTPTASEASPVVSLPQPTWISMAGRVPRPRPSRHRGRSLGADHCAPTPRRRVVPVVPCGTPRMAITSTSTRSPAGGLKPAAESYEYPPP